MQAGSAACLCLDIVDNLHLEASGFKLLFGNCQTRCLSARDAGIRFVMPGEFVDNQLVILESTDTCCLNRVPYG